MLVYVLQLDKLLNFQQVRILTGNMCAINNALSAERAADC